jgi:mannose/cellobiose epimerase-like protein (N-acyl-D-glucosamine 2-epimerase family)
MQQASTRAREEAAKARTWVIERALPLWGRAGFDTDAGSFHERLAFDANPIMAQPRRLMVQARQVYVFSHASLLGWYPAGRELAMRAMEQIVARYWCADGAPGWVDAVGADGRVLNAMRSAYAHAFVLYAIGWCLQLERNPRLEVLARETVGFLDAALASPHGGFVDALPNPPAERCQNPHMHLLEAFLSLYAATGDAGYLKRGGEIVKLLLRRFFRPSSQILAEYFTADWQPAPGERGRLWEPGHHFEWTWLLHCYTRTVGKREDVSRTATLLYDQACRHGIDGQGFVVDEVREDGVHTKPSRRSWPHTEGVKAACAEFEAGRAGADERAADLLAVLQRHYLGRPVSGGWIDHIGPDGSPLVDYIPASTLYHVFLAIAEAERVLRGCRALRA